MAYRIKNWEKFQHYKNLGGHPAWVKLYRDLLNDLEWHKLNGDCAKALVMIWLIGSSTGGILPEMNALCFALRMPEVKVKGLLSRLSHWVYNDSSVALEKPYDDAIPEENKKRREEEKKDDRSGDLLFQTFWHEYPRKVAKAAAKRAWDQLRPNDELLRKMVEAIRVQKKTQQWTKDGGGFIPHPTTWINQRRWEDEIPKGGFGGKPKDEIDRLFERDEKRNREVRSDGGPNTLGEVSSLLRGVDKT